MSPSSQAHACFPSSFTLLFVSCKPLSSFTFTSVLCALLACSWAKVIHGQQSLCSWFICQDTLNDTIWKNTFTELRKNISNKNKLQVFEGLVKCECIYTNWTIAERPKFCKKASLESRNCWHYHFKIKMICQNIHYYFLYYRFPSFSFLKRN